MTGSNNWQKLPDELAERILVLLPISSFLACLCVCRRWNSLLSSACFASLWESAVATAACPQEFWFLVNRCCGSIEAYNPGSRRWDHLPAYSLCFLDPAQVLPLASSGGLLCFRKNWGFPNITICNPLTRSCRKLPRLQQIHDIDILGMVTDGRTNSYHILVIGRKEHTSSRTTEVYDSRTGRWEHHSRSSQEFLQSFYEVHAIWHEGSFYCLATLNSNLIAYDMATKEWMDLEVVFPPTLGQRLVRRPSLVASGGKLLLVGKLIHRIKSRIICIWELDKWEGGFRWVMLDSMPGNLFEEMLPHSTFFKCQSHGQLVCFSTNRGMKSVMYDLAGRTWYLLPENHGCRESGLQEAGKNDLVGLPYEPSLTARV